MNSKILIVEDEAKLREVLCDYFSSKGELPVEASNGMQALELIDENEFDAVLLDIMMPELDGLSVCRAVRRTNDVPIIFLTALSDEDDKLLGYELGADDYITKPFSMSVLYAKTMALIKRNQRNVLAGDRMETGGITLELAAGRVFADKKEVLLTPKEFAILRCLMQNKNLVMSREQLLVKCWGYCTTNYFEKRQDHFVCANYRSNTGSCSAHFIRAVVLEELVWMHMRTVISYVSRYEDHFRAVMEQKLRLSSEAAIRGHKKRLAQAEKRLGELDRLFIRIYEDNVAGRITDEKFSMMSKTYEDEQAQLKEEIQTLQKEIEVQERQIENLKQFIQRVRKYEDLDELTPYALRELVKAIYIEAPDKSSGKRHQGIRISYDLVGFIPVEELLEQETA